MKVSTALVMLVLLLLFVLIGWNGIPFEFGAGDLKLEPILVRIGITLLNVAVMEIVAFLFLFIHDCSVEANRQAREGRGDEN